MFTGPEITLEQVLTNKEQRVMRQRDLLTRHAQPLVSFTINMAGAIKRNQAAHLAYIEGRQAIEACCQQLGWAVLERVEIDEPTGLELLLSVRNASPASLKRQMVSIEETTALGRLFDIDVLDPDGGAVSRDTLGLGRRRCLVCDEQAKVCARSRTHTLAELQQKMSEMIYDCQ